MPIAWQPGRSMIQGHLGHTNFYAPSLKGLPGASSNRDHFTDITCPWGVGRVKCRIWILPDFDFVAARGIHVSQTRLVPFVTR